MSHINKQHKFPRPRVGDTGWFVEWCVKVGMVNEDYSEYGCDPDMDVLRTRRVSSKEEAERVAVVLWPDIEQNGRPISYWSATFVPYDEADASLYPHAGFWECDQEFPFYYEGPE